MTTHPPQPNPPNPEDELRTLARELAKSTSDFDTLTRTVMEQVATRGLAQALVRQLVDNAARDAIHRARKADGTLVRPTQNPSARTQAASGYCAAIKLSKKHKTDATTAKESRP